MAQFKRIVSDRSGKAHYRLTMGPKEAASLVALLDHSPYTGHYLDAVATAVNEAEVSFDLPAIEIADAAYGLLAHGEITVE